MALDMDGTLLTSAKRVSAPTLAALRALLALDLHVVAVTGKAPGLTTRCLEPLELPMVCLDGAVLTQTRGAEQWVPGGVIDDRLASAIIAASSLPCYVIAGGVIFRRGAMGEPQFRDWSDRVLPLAAQTRLTRVTHVVFPCRDRGALKRLAARIGDRTLSLYVTDELFHGSYSLFVRSAACTKLSGMRVLLAGLRSSLSETMFIGDWMNDIPLLRAVGFPVAMRHAPPAVSACARAVTLFSNDEEGVSRFLGAYFALGA